MHILHLPKWYPHPGDPQLGIFIQNHVKCIARHNKSTLVHVLPGRKKAYSVHTNKTGNFTEITVIFPEPTGVFSGLRRKFSQLKAWIKGIRYVNKTEGKFDGIHAHVLLRPGILAWLFARLWGIPFIISEHWSGYNTEAFKQKPTIWKFLARKISAKACYVITVSDSLRKNMEKADIKGRYKIIGNVVNIPETADPPRSEPGHPNVVVISDLVDSIKNISDIIREFAALQKKYPRAKLHIGGDGPDRNMLIDLTNEMNLLHSNVVFYGRLTHPEVHSILEQSDFIVINSYTETFSVVAAEALLHGKPVISTRCGGPETFINENCGILINAGNREELREALEKMFNQYMDYNPENLQEHIKRRFSCAAIGKEYDALYRECFKSHKQS